MWSSGDGVVSSALCVSSIHAPVDRHPANLVSETLSVFDLSSVDIGFPFLIVVVMLGACKGIAATMP
tara:strand:- start:421 stop:621 length:201 start_codon:yes stop_codon:yes gene_type:complete